MTQLVDNLFQWHGLVAPQWHGLPAPQWHGLPARESRYSATFDRYADRNQQERSDSLVVAVGRGARVELVGVPTNATEYRRPWAGSPCHFGRPWAGSPCHWRPAFSFTEILFAVMILGIGFIMVAAVFPVAIKQTQETVEETTAADIAKGAASYMARIGTNANFPATINSAGFSGIVVPFTGYSGAPSPTSPAFWQQVSGNLILSTDSRYAWVPFYSRNRVATSTGAPLPYAQVTIIAVQCKNSSNFSNADLTVPDSSSNFNLQARLLTANFTSQGPNTSTPDTITFTGLYANAVAEGCYVVVADDSALSNVKSHPEQSNDGFVYRVGVQRPDIGPTVWELMPGGDTKTATPGIHPAPTNGPVQVYVVGRGFNNASGGTVDTTLAGPAMDIAAYSTFIQIH